MGVNSLPKKTVTRQRRGCDLNPGASAPESSMLTARLPSHTPIRGLASLWTIVRRIIDTAHIVCGAGSMHLSDVCPSVCLCPFVRLSVCPVRRPGDLDRLLHGGQQQQPRRTTARSSESCGQCHIVI